MKKITACLLAVILVFSMAVPAFAAVTPTVSATAVTAGSDVTVTLELDETLTGITTFDYRLYFDSELFALKSSSNGTAHEGTQITGVKTDSKNNKTYVGISLVDTNSVGLTVSAGTLYTVVFTAKEDLTEEQTAAFELTRFSMMDNTWGDPGTGVVTNGTVTVTVQKEAPSVTKYTIDISNITKGTVNAGKAEAAEGETVTLTVTPDEGYKLESLTVLNGQTPVEVKDNQFTMPAGNVTVSATFAAIPAGYNVKMGTDLTADNHKAVKASEPIQVPINVGCLAAENETAATSFNSYELTITYDADALELQDATNENKDFSVDDITEEGAENKTVLIRRHGDAINLGEGAIKLNFVANKVGTHTVTIDKAKVGNSQSAENLDIPEAELLDDEIQIEVAGYNVTLDDTVFEGETTVDPAQDYTFSVKDTNYDYTSVTAAYKNAEGQDVSVDVTDNEDGTYTIKAGKIAGDVTISFERSGKLFDVTIDGNGAAQMSPVGDGATIGENAAQYMKDYAVKLTSQGDGYSYSVEIKIGTGEDATYTCTPVDGVYTILGKDIVDDITITVVETAPTVEDHNVTFQGSGVENVTSGTENQKVAHNGTYTFNLLKAKGYEYTVSAVMGTENKDVTKAQEANADGSYTYTVTDITADLTITIEKSDLQVEIYNYVAMADNKTAYLVVATQTLADGKTLGYADGTDENGAQKYAPMFYRDVTVEAAEGETEAKTVRKYYWLDIQAKPAEDQDASFTKEVAAAKITAMEANSTELVKTFNVNGSPSTDINDAQLVYDMYNALYGSFTDTVTMQKYLQADLSGDNKLDVQDTVAIVNHLLGNDATA